MYTFHASYNNVKRTTVRMSSHTYLSSYPGYFREPHWKSMGPAEISRVTWQVFKHSESIPFLSSELMKSHHQYQKRRRKMTHVAKARRGAFGIDLTFRSTPTTPSRSRQQSAARRPSQFRLQDRVGSPTMRDTIRPISPHKSLTSRRPSRPTTPLSRPGSTASSAGNRTGRRVSMDMGNDSKTFLTFPPLKVEDRWNTVYNLYETLLIENLWKAVRWRPTPPLTHSALLKAWIEHYVLQCWCENIGDYDILLLWTTIIHTWKWLWTK